MSLMGSPFLSICSVVNYGWFVSKPIMNSYSISNGWSDMYFTKSFAVNKTAKISHFNEVWMYYSISELSKTPRPIEICVQRVTMINQSRSVWPHIKHSKQLYLLIDAWQCIAWIQSIKEQRHCKMRWFMLSGIAILWSLIIISYYTSRCSDVFDHRIVGYKLAENDTFI